MRGPSVRIAVRALCAATLVVLGACNNGDREQTVPILATPSPGQDVVIAVLPIEATFTAAEFSTSYKVKVPMRGYTSDKYERSPYNVFFQWTGTNCGSMTTGSSGDFGAEPHATSAMTWAHPHPPCGQTTDHLDATIVVTVSTSSGIWICTYRGSASGTGPPCQKT